MIIMLEKIVAKTKERLIEAKSNKSLDELKGEVSSLDINDEFPFKKALKDPEIAIIAEVKKASPSKGLIAEDFDSYLGGEWYIDEMKTAANDAAGVPFTLPKYKYTYMNDWVPIKEVIDRPVNIKEVMSFIRSDDRASQIKLVDGSYADYLPTRKIALPVDKENAIRSGIVKEEDRSLMVDTVYMELRGSSIDKNKLMILDMLSNFDWKRPIYLTQVYILQDLGLMDYLQFDGYAYRLARNPRARRT